ncbi:uncharacterized protein LOC122974245 [Thunnus albacares]|uniref:uncharacterized protein LOC122974245 n=1 Tax=Thunnus albacares TaxID=8236 RepID=UPI001CF6A0D0|nr:uncharacterized protein LOC122974245 [Thunnus albacares]
MAALLKAVLLLSFCQLFSASAGPQPEQVTVHPGDTVVLSCEAPNNINIGAVEWTRTDLQSYVYFQRGKRPLTQDQDPSFVDRVQLKGKMEDGDLSLILKNVSSNDKGTYECRYKEIERKRWKRAAINGEPINIFELNVEAGNTEGGHLGIILPVTGLIVLVVLAAVVGLVTFKKCKGRLEKNSDWSDDDPDTLQHLQENENSQSKSITRNTSDIQV